MENFKKLKTWQLFELPKADKTTKYQSIPIAS